MPIGQMLAVATITGARRASDQTQERARSHQSQANLAADRSLAYTRFMHPGALRGMGTQEALEPTGALESGAGDGLAAALAAATRLKSSWHTARMATLDSPGYLAM